MSSPAVWLPFSNVMQRVIARYMVQSTLFQENENWNRYLIFPEYFHGDSGKGSGRQPPDGLDRPRRETD